MRMDEIATISPMETFQQKVVDKLKADIGVMLPDEVLTGLVQRAIDEQFFQPRIEQDNYSRRTEHPSWFVEEITKLAEPMLRKMLTEIVKEREPEIKKAIEEFLSTQNLMLITIAAMQNATRDDIYQFASMIAERLKQP